MPGNTVEVRVGANIQPLRAGLQAGRAEVGNFVQGVGQQMSGAQQQVAGLGEQLRQGLVQGVGMQVTNVAFQGIAAGATKAKDAVIGFNSTLQQFSIGLETLVGAGTDSVAFMEQLKQFAKSTPFNFADVQDGTRRLLAMGFAAEEIIPVMRAVGNQVAGVGTGKAGLDRVSLALGQMSAKTKVSAEEMRQLTEAGVPAWTILAKAIGKTEAETMKLAENGAIAGDTMVKAFVDSYGALGLMDKQAKTFQGALSNVQDALSFAFADIGRGAFDAVTVGINSVADALNGKEFQVWAGVAKDALAGIGQSIQGLMARFAPFGNELRAAFDAFTSGDVAGGMAHIQQAVKVVLDGIVHMVQGYAQALFGAGSNMMVSLSQGIIGGGMSAVQGAVNAVATIISSFLIGHSPPPQGPLAQITQGGQALMESYIQGMLGGVGNVGSVAMAVADAMGNVSSDVSMDAARAGIQAAAGDLKAMEAQATRVEGVVRAIDADIKDNELAQKGVKLAVDDTKAAYDSVLNPLQKQIEAIKNEGAERTRMIDITGRVMDVQDRLTGADQRRVDLIQKQSDLMQRQADIQSRMAMLDARQAVAAAKGDPYERARVLAQIDSVRVRQDELSTTKDLEDIDKRLADDVQKRIDYQKQLTDAKKKGKDGETKEPPKEPDYLTDTEKTALAAKREELQLQRQLQGMVDKPALASADAKVKELEVTGDIQAAVREQTQAAQDQLKIQTELAGIPRERARIEFDVVKALDEQSRISREIMALPLEQLAKELKDEEEAQLKPLQDQADTLSRQGELLSAIRGQWQDIGSQAKDATSAMKEAAEAAKAAAAGGPGGGGTKDPNRITREAIVAGVEEEANAAGQRLSQRLAEGFNEYTKTNFGPLTMGVMGSVLGGLTFGPMGALVGGALGKDLGAGIQAQVPDLQARVQAGFLQIQEQGLIPSIQAWWPAIEPQLQSMGTQLLGWIQQQAPPILQQLGVWTNQFIDWAGPAIGELMGALGRSLEPFMQYLKDQAPNIGKSLVDWTVRFVTWATDTLKQVRDWFVSDGIPGMLEIGAGLAKGIADGLDAHRAEIVGAFKTVFREAVKAALIGSGLPAPLAEGIVSGVGGVFQGGGGDQAVAETNLQGINSLNRQITAGVAGSSAQVDEALAAAVHAGFAAPSERGPGGAGELAFSQGELLAQQLAAGLANGNAQVATAIGAIVKSALDNGMDPLIALATSKAESELDTFAAKVDSREASYGLFQHNTRGGQGAGISPALLQNPAFSARMFLGQHAGLYQKLAGQGLAGRDLAMEFGSKAEVSAPEYKGRYGVAYDQIIAAVGGKINAAGKINPQSMVPTRSINQFDLGLNPADAAAACGPAAAMTFAQMTGRMPTAQEAIQLAQKSGWTHEGMGGPANFQKLVGMMGMQSALDMTPSGEEIDAALKAGHPVAISTPAHYFTATGGTAAGGLNVGGSGKAIDGDEVMTLNQIAAKGGGLQATITLLDQVKTAGAQIGPVLAGVIQGMSGVGQTLQAQVDPALLRFQELLAGSVPAAGIEAGNAIQKMAAQSAPLFNQFANGQIDVEDLSVKLLELASSTGASAEPLQRFKDGTMTSQQAVDLLLMKLSNSDPAFAAIDAGFSGINVGGAAANLILQGLANTTGVAGAAVLQMGQNIQPLIQQVTSGAISGDQLSSTLVTLASNAGLSSVPLRQLSDGLTTADQAFAQVLKSAADVSPEFRALYDEVQKGGQVTDAVRKQFLNLLDAYAKNQEGVKKTGETQAGIAPTTQTTWDQVIKTTQDSVGLAVGITQEGMNKIVAAIGSTAGPASDAAKTVGDAIVGGIQSVVDDGADRIAKSAAEAVKKAMDAARSAAGSKGGGDKGDDGGDDRGFAQGGVINEMVVGVGQTTGARYTFGEAGSEVVVPLGEASQHWEFAKGSKKKPKKGAAAQQGKIPPELQSLAQAVADMMATINDMAADEAAGTLEDIRARFQGVKPTLQGLRDLEKQIAQLKLQQADAARALVPIQQEIEATTKRVQDAQRGTVEDQIKQLDFKREGLELSTREIQAQAQLRAEFPLQLDVQQQTLGLDRDIAAQRVRTAQLDQQLLGPRRELRDIEAEINRIQHQSADILKAAVDRETSRNVVSLEALQLQRQIASLEKAGFQGTVSEQVAQQYSVNLLRDKLKALEEQGTELDQINQMEQLRQQIAGATDQKRVIDLQEASYRQNLSIDAATQALQDQLAPMEAQSAILQAQQQLLEASKAIREAELMGPIEAARQNLQDQQTILSNTLQLQAIGAERDLVYLQDRLRLQSSTSDQLERQLASITAEQSYFQALLSTVTLLNQQISSAGLVPQNQTTTITTTTKKRALGGPALRGDQLVVGEKGPEVFTPEEDGWIVPIAQGRALGHRGSAGNTYIVNVYVEGSVIRERDLVQQIRSGLIRTAQRNVSGGLN